MLEIIKPGLMTSIQDLGRKGLAYYAIPHSGAMDSNSARVALLLLNLEEDHPLIECTSVAPHILFHQDTEAVITGANFGWELNGKPLLLNTPFTIEKGDRLTGKQSRNGLRGYIAIREKLDVKAVYESYSTYINAGFGGFKGRLLKRGDKIHWETPSTSIAKGITLRKGPEYELLTDEAKFLLYNKKFQVGIDSNRMGLRLKGPQLQATSHQLENSVPVLQGFVQLPPNGQAIILLQDGQVTGGYPRIAYVPERELPKLNQINLGESFTFLSS